MMRSGVGPAAELSALGISVVADVPAVGSNLQDHPVAWLRLPLRAAARLRSLDTLPGHCVLRFAPDSATADGDVEVLAADRGLLDVDEGALMIGLMRPASRGKVTLVAAAPSVPPRVELGMLSAADDLRRLRAGVRHAARLASHRAFARILDGRAVLAGARPDGSDEELDRALLASCGRYFHAAGTCAMGARGDPRAVTDSGGWVVGVERLRVIDASLIPMLPCTPPYLTTVMLAEHLSRAWLGEARHAYARPA
jgi:choline dehydrogenase